MRIGEAIERLNGAQRSRRFKIVATVVVATLAILGVIAVGVAATAPDSAAKVAAAAAQAASAEEAIRAAQQTAQGGVGAPTPGALSALGPRPNPIVMGALGIGALAGVALLVVWLGLALTYLALMAAAALIAAPLLAFGATRSMGEMSLGVILLTASFFAVSRGLALALSKAGPVFAIARNVLAEAVRMKISLVFIVLLVFFLAGLPFFLNDEQPLRYRVQMFLQYGTGGTFWVLALLTAFFSIATVAFEQRDKVIWQTMSKPVAPWQYLLGKWLGVVALNTALLAVAATGVFLFTQRLRVEPAHGEIRAYVAEDGSPTVTDDRRILESQVLTARVGRKISPPVIDQALLERQVDEEFNELGTVSGKKFDLTRRSIREQMLREINLQHRTVDPGGSEEYVFEGLGEARGSLRPLTVRFKINSGSDNPSALLRVTFVIAGQYVVRREAVLNTAQVFDIPDDVVPPGTPGRDRLLRDVRTNCVDEQGRMAVQVWNGDPVLGVANPRAISFPPDGLEVLYAAGSYESNFLRVALVLWLKLGFIAAIGIAAATFLSFPVACLVTMGMLFVVETSAYLTESLDFYNADTGQGVNYVMVAARAVALPIAWLFRWYGELTPTANLTDGRLVSWEALAQGVGALGLCSLIAFGTGWLVFRKRELAMYSGK